MHIIIVLRYDLTTGKRVGRTAVLWDPVAGEEVTSELTKQLLLPRTLPQEWLPTSARMHAAGPVRSWIDRSLFEEDESGGPEGFRA